MNKKRILCLNIFVILVAIIYTFVLVIGNVGTVKSAVAVEDGSYAKQYAEDNNLAMVTLADSEKVYFDQRYETFSYNVENGKIILEQYAGKSTELVIPEMISGIKVCKLSADFIKSLDTVKKIYIPLSVNEIDGDAVNTLIVCCANDNSFYKENAESDWNFETIYDSTYINFDMGDNPFEYNINGGNVEIKRYFGDEKKFVVIPSHIDGMPVTDISMDLLGTADIFVIPKTVTNITGTSVKHIYSLVFAIELIFTVLAMIISLVVVNVLLPRFKKNNLDEFLLTGNQIIAVSLYVIVQTGFSIYCIYYSSLSAYIALVISLIIMVVFIAVVMMDGAGRNHVQTVEKHIEEKTSRMKSIKLSAKNLSIDIKDQETKKIVQRLEDEIRFSDAVTSDALDDIESIIESRIGELKEIIATGKMDDIKTAANNLMKLVQERNQRCKVGK